MRRHVCAGFLLGLAAVAVGDRIFGPFHPIPWFVIAILLIGAGINLLPEPRS